MVLSLCQYFIRPNYEFALQRCAGNYDEPREIPRDTMTFSARPLSSLGKRKIKWMDRIDWAQCVVAWVAIAVGVSGFAFGVFNLVWSTFFDGNLGVLPTLLSLSIGGYLLLDGTAALGIKRGIRSGFYRRLKNKDVCCFERKKSKRVISTIVVHLNVDGELQCFLAKGDHKVVNSQANLAYRYARFTRKNRINPNPHT